MVVLKFKWKSFSVLVGIVFTMSIFLFIGIYEVDAHTWPGLSVSPSNFTQGTVTTINITGRHIGFRSTQICPIPPPLGGLAGKDPYDLYQMRYNPSWGSSGVIVAGDWWIFQDGIVHPQCGPAPDLYKPFEYDFDFDIDVSGLGSGIHTIVLETLEDYLDFGGTAWFSSALSTITITVDPAPTITVVASATPSSGSDPLLSLIEGTVGGTATGNIRYRIDCTNDGGFEFDFISGSTTDGRNCTYSSPGSYTARVRADRGGVWAEDTVGITVFDATAPDLEAENPMITSGPPVAGSLVSFSGRVRNVGDASAGSTSNIRLCIDLNSAGYVACDVDLGVRTTSNLGVGASDTDNWINTWTAVLGSHTMRIIADDSDSVSESDESVASNTQDLSFIVIAAPLPDLIADTISSPGGLVGGDFISLSGTVRNQGTALAAASLARFCIDLNSNNVPDDCLNQQIGSTSPSIRNNIATGALSAGGAEVKSAPWTAIAGTHTVVVCVDINNDEPGESDESNCFDGSSFTVAASLPDLIADTISSPSGLVGGDFISLSGTVRNQGTALAAASLARFCIDLNSNNVPDDCLNQQIGSTSPSIRNNIATGALSAGGAEVKSAPWTAIAGTHTVVVCVDINNDEPGESDESNCFDGSSFTVAVAPPDLTVDNHDARPNGYPSGTPIIPGDFVTFSADVINLGIGDTTGTFFTDMWVDINGNGVYDAGTDVAPGQQSTGPLSAGGGTQTIIWNNLDLGALAPGIYQYNICTDILNDENEFPEPPNDANNCDITGGYWQSFEVVDGGGFVARFFEDVNQNGDLDLNGGWGRGNERPIRDSSLGLCDAFDLVLAGAEFTAIHNDTGEVVGSVVSNQCNIPGNNNPDGISVPRYRTPSLTMRPGAWTISASAIPAGYSLNEVNNVTYIINSGSRVQTGSWALGPPDIAPTASGLTELAPGNFCTPKPPLHQFSWTYDDADGDNQTEYTLQIDDDAGFGSPEVDITITGLNFAPPALNGQLVPVTTLNNPNQLNYDRTYFWRVQVSNIVAASAWVSGALFTTPVNEYPTPNFTFAPSDPTAGEDVNFTDTSVCFDSDAPSCNSWSWTFQNGVPAISSNQNEVVQFAQGDNDVTLTTTDENGFSCTALVQTLTIVQPIPDFIEVHPLGFMDYFKKFLAFVGI